MIRRGCCLSLCMALFAIFSPAASAQTSIRGTVMRFQGPGAAAMRRHVVRALESEIDLSPESAFRELAESIGERLDSDSGVGRVASQMGLTLVIRGMVEGRGRRARLRLWAVDSMGVQLGSEDAGRPAGRPGRARAVEAATALVSGARIALEERARELERRAREAQAEQERAEAEQIEEEVVANAAPWLLVMVGGGGRSRQATIETPSPRSYNAPLLAELTLGVELQPFASAEGAKRGLFFGFGFGQSLGARSIDPMGMIEVDTSAMRIAVDLGFLHEIGDGGFRIGGLAGFHLDSFTLGANSVLASSSYSQLRVGARADIPISGHLIGVGLDVGFRYALSVGDLAGAYGADAGAIGFDAGVRFRGHLEMGLAYGLSVGYQYHALSFSGPFAVGQASGGSDAALLLSAELGYAFR